MKRVLWLIGIIVVLLGAFKFYKKWQYDSMGYSQPKRQTVESIKATAMANNIPGEVLIPKDTNAYKFLHEHFGPGMIYVFDHTGAVVTNNLTNYGGLCYSEIVDRISHNFDFPKSSKMASINGKQLLDSLLALSSPINSKVTPGRRWNFTIVYGWASYIKASYSKDLMKFQEDLSRQSDKSVLVLSVNTDYVNTWYPASEQVPIINFH